MKLTLQKNVSNLTDVKELGRFVQIAFDDIENIINGNIEFGQNINAKQIDVSFPSADTDTPFKHGLGRLPTGFLVVGADSPAIIYNSPTTNTTDIIYLRCNAAGPNMKVLVY